MIADFTRQVFCITENLLFALWHSFVTPGSDELPEKRRFSRQNRFVPIECNTSLTTVQQMGKLKKIELLILFGFCDIITVAKQT